MPADIVLIHDDATFSHDLAAQIRLEGHNVRVFDDLTITLPTLRAADVLELAIVRPADVRNGLRIKVVGIPSGAPYAGPLIKFLVEPITVADVVNALSAFLPE